jgi:ankyrin repeat protein
MPALPARPSLEHLRKQAKAHRRRRDISLARAQHEIAISYGFVSWPRLVRHVETLDLRGIERALARADADALRALLRVEPEAAQSPIGDLAPLLVLLRDSDGAPCDLRACVALLLDAGADPNASVELDQGDWRMSALFLATGKHDLSLVRLLLDAGATPDEDAFYHACEQSDQAFLEALYRPGFESSVIHKLDFEDAAGLRWFLERGVDVNALGCLHWAIGRGRGVGVLQLLLEAGADVNQPHPRLGVRPLAVAARCGHLAAYDLLAAHGARGELDQVQAAVLAVARGQAAVLPAAPPPLPGIPGPDSRWLLGQFALLNQIEVVRTLLDGGLDVDSAGWSGFTPLKQAAMHGRAAMVALLIERGGDVNHGVFDPSTPTPLDCAIWALNANRAEDGDYPGTVEELIRAEAVTDLRPPTGDPAIDAMLNAYLSRCDE